MSIYKKGSTVSLLNKKIQFLICQNIYKKFTLLYAYL